MKTRISMVFSVLTLASSLTLAGEMYSGWGENPEAAMAAAMQRAKSDSPGGCICKGWGPNIEDLCKKSTKLGGFVCTACGSNHNGSCESQAEIDRIVRDVGKLKQLM